MRKKSKIPEYDKRAKEFFPPRKHEAGVGGLCLVVDGMNLAYAAFHAYAKLSSGGISTSIIYGFPSMLKSLMQYHRPQKVVVCWDGEPNPKRLQLLPEYKEKRLRNRDPKERSLFLKQVRRLRVLLNAMGIPQAYNPKMEGDDMIYWVTKYESNLNKVCIISGDHDMFQLINYDVKVFKPITKEVYTHFAFITFAQVEPYQYLDYLCLLGDKSDCIPGYRGIGPVRAMKFLLQYGSIRNYLKNKRAEFSGISDKKELKRIWKRNRLLIGLKRFNTKYHTEEDVTYYKDKRMPNFNEKKFERLCRKYNLKTFLTQDFKKPFKALNE